MPGVGLACNSLARAAADRAVRTSGGSWQRCPRSGVACSERSAGTALIKTMLRHPRMALVVPPMMRAHPLRVCCRAVLHGSAVWGGDDSSCGAEPTVLPLA